MAALRSWVQERRAPSAKSFEDRALGEVFAEFYFDVADRARDMRRRFETLTPEEQLRLNDLEDIFREGDDAPRGNLADLTPEESEDEWFTAHQTGDPLVDKWEREIAAGLTPDLDEQQERAI